MKKMNKLQKFLLAAFAISIGFFAAVGISLNAMTACAEESTENTEILDDSATDEEVVDGEETSENSAILDEIKDYLDSRKDEEGKFDFAAMFTDVKFWIYEALKGLGITGVCSLVIALVNRKNRKDNVLTDAHIERVATAAAKKTAESIIGKSIDVDISAEVSKAVKKELYALSKTMDSLVDGVKNTEMLVAREAIALSHSRILGAGEKKALVEGAKKAEEHAGKVVSTAKVEFALTEPSTKSETEKTESVEEKNIHFINFSGVEKK